MLPCEQESDIRNHSKVPSDAPRQVGEDKALSMLTKLCMSDGTGTVRLVFEMSAGYDGD